MRTRYLPFAALAGALVVLPSVGFTACPERPPCHGCGCKGGPGYRGPDGDCVGFRELDKVCGNPPARCVFENAPGTGANRECALAPRRKPEEKQAEELSPPAPFGLANRPRPMLETARITRCFDPARSVAQLVEHRSPNSGTAVSGCAAK